MDQQLKDWFAEKVVRSPEFLKHRYFPCVEKLAETAHLALHEADRKGDLLAIKYAIGRLDGVQEVLNLISGLRMSESKPAESGLMTRTLDYGRQLLKQASRQ